MGVGQVHGDAIDPGLHAGIALELVTFLPDTHEGILQNVLSILMVLHDTLNEQVKVLREPPDELVKTCLLPSTDPVK